MNQVALNLSTMTALEKASFAQNVGSALIENEGTFPEQPIAGADLYDFATAVKAALTETDVARATWREMISAQNDMLATLEGYLRQVATYVQSVSGFAEGDPVVIGWPSCRTCRNCRAGEPRYCLRLGEVLAGGGRLDGASALRRPDGRSVSSHFFGQSSFATYSLTTAAALVRVPAGLPLELMGPLACGISTGAGAVFNTARPEPGASLAVYGVGTVGLAAVMAARNSAATRIIAVDRHEARLAKAMELGATHVVNAGVDDPVRGIADICGGPADYALECTGVISVVRQAVDSVGMLGTCILIGGAPAGAEFSVDHISTLWGKRIVGVLGGSGRSAELMGSLMELYSQGRFPFDRLVQYFDLADVQGALEASYRGEVIKPIVTMH